MSQGGVGVEGQLQGERLDVTRASEHEEEVEGGKPNGSDEGRLRHLEAGGGKLRGVQGGNMEGMLAGKQLGKPTAPSGDDYPAQGAEHKGEAHTSPPTDIALWHRLPP